MNSNKKDKRIELRVTEEEHKKIKEEAEKNNTTMSALLLRRFENNVTVYLDTSDYRDLVIQVRRIGTNINTLLKHIHFFGFAEQSDIKRIKNKLNDIERKLKEEERKINDTRKGLENITPRKAKIMFEQQKKTIPLYLIYDEVVSHINTHLLNFIEMMKEFNWNEGYRPFIELFIEEFIPTEYDYEELVLFSNELDTLFYKINQRIISRIGELEEEDFNQLMEILNKYRKDIDE